jgi:hypothetical protein
MKNAVFWDVTPCAASTNEERSVLRLLVTANVAASSLIHSTLMMEAIVPTNSSCS